MPVLGATCGGRPNIANNVVTKVSKNSPAEAFGVREGWQLVEIAGREVVDTTYVPDRLVELRRASGPFLVKFVTPEGVREQEAASAAIPTLRAAVDRAQEAYQALGGAEAASGTTQTAPPLQAGAVDAIALYHAQNVLDAYAPTFQQLDVLMGAKDKDEIISPACVPSQDPYQTLGLLPTASQEEIKAAFRELVVQFHPDKFPEDPETAQARFDGIKKAYDRLRNPEVRSKVDRSQGIVDFFTAWNNGGGDVLRKFVTNVPLALTDEEPGAGVRSQPVDEELRRRGQVKVKYYDYTLPFDVADGRLKAEDIDAVYAITHTNEGAALHLASWRTGDAHLVEPGQMAAASEASALVAREGGVFCGLEAGHTYFLLVEESKQVVRKRELGRRCDARRVAAERGAAEQEKQRQESFKDLDAERARREAQAKAPGRRLSTFEQAYKEWGDRCNNSWDHQGAIPAGLVVSFV